MKMTIENITDGQAFALLSILDPEHRGELVEEKFTSTNTTQPAIELAEKYMKQPHTSLRTKRELGAFVDWLKQQQASGPSVGVNRNHKGGLQWQDRK